MCFSEGNVFVRVLENVRGRDVFIVQGTDYPVNDNFMELLFWIDAFKRASATQVTAVIPFFSYAKGDKKDEPRVSIRARVCADCIEAAGADRVLTMDLHSPQIQGFFKIPVDHLYAMPVLVDYFRAKKIPDLVVAAPDVGFGKQAYRFAEMMNAAGRLRQQDPARPRREGRDARHHRPGRGQERPDRRRLHDLRRHADRDGRRLQGARGHATSTPASRTASSPRARPPRSPQSPIKELVLTDTIGYRFEPLAPCCKVVSVAGLFAEAILSIHRRESVSRLFNYRATAERRARPTPATASSASTSVRAAACLAGHPRRVDFRPPAA